LPAPIGHADRGHKQHPEQLRPNIPCDLTPTPPPNTPAHIHLADRRNTVLSQRNGALQRRSAVLWQHNGALQRRSAVLSRRNGVLQCRNAVLSRRNGVL
jgi:hypothetical protein